MAKDTEITDHIDRIEEIIEQLESDDYSLSAGEDLFEEGQEHLEGLREIVESGDGEIIELE